MHDSDGTDASEFDARNADAAVRAPDDSSGSVSGSSADEPTRASDLSRSPPDASQISADAPPIDGYVLHERIHHGGQGIVFRATQLGTKRVVALKVLLEGEYASETARQRFEREVELAASLHHPNIVTILDSGVSRGRCYFAMEYIDGPRLQDYFRKRRPDLKETIELVERVANAVNFAHQRGVIHRDLKPSNILVDSDDQPRVLDFGLAKSRREHDPRGTTVEALSMPGQVLGTLAYMSPEQAAGSADVDVRSDVYSLGVVAYEALLGRAPYSVDGPLGEVLNRIARDDPQRPRSVRSSSRFGRLIDDELETILLKALDKDPDRRYQTAGDLGRDFRHYLEGRPIEAKRASGMYMFRKALRRYRLQAAFAAVVLAMLVTFLVVFAVQYRQERSLRARAEELQTLAAERADQAGAAEQREREARRQAEEERRLAVVAAEERRLALVRQGIQAGDLAILRADPAEARDHYWEALHDAPDNLAAQWALRQYYVTSGELDAYQLYVQPEAPIAISAGGRFAAVCESSAAVSLYSLESGECLAWTATPDEVLAVGVDESGRVVAAGRTWARMWSSGSAMPAATVELPNAATPRAVYAVLDGWALALIDGQFVRTYRCTSGRLLSEHRLAGEPTASPQFSAEANTLAVPTTEGIELVQIAADGRLDARQIWSAKVDGAPRAVRFIGAQGLAVLGDAVFVRMLDDSERDAWTFLLRPDGDWNMLDFGDDGRVVGLGSRDGRVAIYREGRLEKQWRISLGGLEQIRLSPDGAACVTLDSRGSVTQWTTRPDAPGTRRLLAHEPRKWTQSRDSRTFLLADDSGRIAFCRPGRKPEITELELPSLLRVFSDIDVTEVSLALDESGDRGVVAYDDQLWLARSDQKRLRPLNWSKLGGLKFGDVAMTDDGRLAAASARRLVDERDAIVILPSNTGRRAGRNRPAIIPVPGSAIRTIRFAPNGADLVVARANGELTLLDADQYARRGPIPPKPPVDSHRPWTVLDAPAYALVFDRHGELLAAACDDGFIRILSLESGAETARINVGRQIASLGFNAEGPLLMARGVDGVLTVFDAGTGERVRRWPTPDSDLGALAAWVGDDDALLFGVKGGVVYIDPAAARATVERNGDYAARRRIVSALSNYEYEQAWTEAGRLRESDETAGRDAQAVILDRILRRGRVGVPANWIETVAAGARPHTLLRLGNAAYDGGRFDVAFALLNDAAASPTDQLDAYTTWRLIECEYLLGDASAAADRLAKLIDRSDFNLRDLPRVYLELLTALTLADRQDDAIRALRTMPTNKRFAPLKNTTAMAATQVIAMTVLDNASNAAPLSGIFGRVEGLATEFRNDVEFVAGEVALKRGETTSAREHYRACLDLDRDEWPADWARFRLEQIESKNNPTEDAQ